MHPISLRLCIRRITIDLMTPSEASAVYSVEWCRKSEYSRIVRKGASECQNSDIRQILPLRIYNFNFVTLLEYAFYLDVMG